MVECDPRNLVESGICKWVVNNVKCQWPNMKENVGLVEKLLAQNVGVLKGSGRGTLGYLLPR